MAREFRNLLKRGGSSEHAAGVQWFFKEEIKSHGWYTAALRREAVRQRHFILLEHDVNFLCQVSDRLFAGKVLEEKIFAVLLLEKLHQKFADAEFGLFESWLARISSWADHDALVHYLIGPMLVAKPSRMTTIFKWAKSGDRWRRRAACVALIAGARRRAFRPQIVRLSNFLLQDEDDMVRKGLGWLLREAAKADAKRTVPYLMKIRGKAPRLVLRTACETLPLATQKKVLQP